MMDEGMRGWSIEVRPDVTTFMDRLTTGDPEQAASGFHDGFLNLDPRTVGVVRREQLRMALPYRARLDQSRRPRHRRRTTGSRRKRIDS